MGETCYIQNYVDADPSADWLDFACGKLTYEGHKGTDFTLYTLKDMQNGVNVLAASGGIVTGVRDGMPDVAITKDTLDSVKGRECGNGVAIDHGEGWVTQYCHMKLGSIAVQKGQKVRTGDPLGRVGLSGKTQFPHLHISLRHKGQVVDPFTPAGADGTCKIVPEDTLWKNPPAYVAGGILRLGFDTKVPAFDEVKSGAAGTVTLSSSAPALVLYVHGFGSQAGDKIQFTMSGPNGFSLTHETAISKPKALYMQAAGKKRRTPTWAAGEYVGTVTIVRDDKIYDQSQLSLTVN
ncbi:M23 family metallopeptidase [Shimia gijangensis]|uniref:M23 family metallopeptidase n=1 Tax=Shimia gijangensis TaxID=1470563 RepID=UPI001FE4AEA5|nr:M23 family metallopeptidase [Shimia gijangensis]